MILETNRLILKPWTHQDLPVFAKLHADPVVMADYGGPITEERSKEKLERYITNYETFGYSRWMVSLKNGAVIGYCGISPSRRPHPLGDHEEIGWRLFPEAWGHGYATESAVASLTDFFTNTDIPTVYSYTAADNARSQGVMRKLGLIRNESLDFMIPDARQGDWRALVWKISKKDFH